MDALRRLRWIWNPRKIGIDKILGPDQPGGVEQLSSCRVHASPGHGFVEPKILDGPLNINIFHLKVK